MDDMKDDDDEDVDEGDDDVLLLLFVLLSYTEKAVGSGAGCLVSIFNRSLILNELTFLLARAVSL
jgi:hypothetical protein